MVSKVGLKTISPNVRKTKRKSSCKKDYEAFMFEADIKTERMLEEVIEEKPSERKIEEKPSEKKKTKAPNVKTKISEPLKKSP